MPSADITLDLSDEEKLFGLGDMDGEVMYECNGRRAKSGLEIIGGNLGIICGLE